ncbi:receptor mediated endocytosis 8 isoform X2 [Lycorma delicatula]
MMSLPDNEEVASYLCTKHSVWKGKYKRTFSVGTAGLTTYKNVLEITNRWLYTDLISLKVTPEPGMFIVNIKKNDRSTKGDTMKFGTPYRTDLLTDAFKKCPAIAEKNDTQKYNAVKNHWSDMNLPVLLEITAVSLDQLDTATNQVLASYCYKDIHAFQDVTDFPDGFVVITKTFHRMHLFASSGRLAIQQKVKDMAECNLGIRIDVLPEKISLETFKDLRLGKYSGDEHVTSVTEFKVYKVEKRRHKDSPLRKLCLSQTCLIERDPQTYNIVTLRPLSSISALIRDPDNPQQFTIEYNDYDTRVYFAPHRDALLATLLDGVRSSGNRDVHVKMRPSKRGKYLVPSDEQQVAEIESLHLKFFQHVKETLSFTEVVERFNSNVPYCGLKYSVNQESIFFSENKEKLILAALNSIMKTEFDPAAMNPDDLEAFFQAVHRLVASKVGFSAFTNLPGFREYIGLKVAKALKLDNEAVTHAAVDMVCALMQPMHDDCDLKIEQLNKSSLLSTHSFLENLLDMWIKHVDCGTGALVVTAMLDFLTFALCVPYCETTEGRHFDALLEMVARKGRSLFKHFEHKSLTVVKGAGLVMRAIIEEGDAIVAERMQELALCEGALPRHLLTALFTPHYDQQTDLMLANKQLSRHLVGLWVTGNECAINLLRRIMPPSLLDFLESDEEVPENSDDHLNFRDNLKLAHDHAVKTARNPHLVAFEKQFWIVEKHVERTLEHWWGASLSLERKEDRTKDRPVVLRKRRERVKSVGNWKLFYHKFYQDHSRPNLIWNHKTREELREALENEVRLFNSDRELQDNLIAWNHNEFEVHYRSLSEEVFVDGYYLRLLLDEKSTDCEIKNVNVFFNNLYHRFLLTRAEMKCKCLRAMTVVYAKYHNEIGAFCDTKYIVGMLDRCTDRMERDRYLLFLDRLLLEKQNVKAVLDANGVPILVDLLTLAHLHISRAIVPTQSNVIEAGKDMMKDNEKEWYVAAADKKQGPLTFNEMHDLWKRGTITARTKCWAQGLEGWMPLQSITQLKWCLCADGEALMDESQLSALILSMLIKMCQYYNSRNTDGAVIWPIPRIKRELSKKESLQHVVQVLLTFDPVLVEKVATLLCHIAEDNSIVPNLFETGVFYFILMYTGSNVLPIARFLKLTHTKQAFHNADEAQSSELMQRSILSQLLPEAMVYYLENHGPKKFMEIYLGEYDTPEAIWNSEMRRMLSQKIAAHIADFSPKLRGNNKKCYQFLNIPAIWYPQLENELFCNIFYLRHLCDTQHFPDWPIKEPVNLLRDTLEAWKTEVEKKPPAMSVDDAYEALELERGQHHEETSVRKAYYRLAQKYHPDKNAEGRERFVLMKNAYEFLCSRSSWAENGPNPKNINLILKTQSILFDRYSAELQPYKYAGYKQLVKTIQLETEDAQLFSKSDPLLVSATEVAYHTVSCSALNAEELNRENGFSVLLGAYSRCVSVLSRSSKVNDVAVQVCSHCTRTFTVAAQFSACRNRFIEMPQLIADLARILHFKNLPKLCYETAECISSMAVDTRLQHALINVGVLWHLLTFLFNYDFTLEESGLERKEESNNQEVLNNLAKMSVKALAKLGGFLSNNSEESPRNPVVRDILCKLLTPYLANKFSNEHPEELLKLLTINSQNPYLLWDNSTRAELTDFLETRCRLQPNEGSLEDTIDSTGLSYSRHKSELIIGNVFINIFNDQPTFTVENGKEFVLDLLDYVKENQPRPSENVPTDPEKLINVTKALHALYNVLNNNPGLEIQCIGHFGLIFPLLSLDSVKPIQISVLNMLAVITKNQECIDDIAASQMLVNLLLVLYSLEEKQLVTLDILYPLTTSKTVVKDILAKGGYLYLINIVCNSSVYDVRVKAAELLGRLCSDKLSGPRVRLALGRFLPDAICDAFRDAPSDSIRLLEFNQENPELVWDAESRKHVADVVAALSRRHFQNQYVNHSVQLKLPEKSMLGTETKEVVVGGVYLRLFNKHPGWALRHPKEFLSALLDFILQIIAKDPLNVELLDMAIAALVNLLQAQPKLADDVPALGHIPRICAQIKNNHAQPQIPLSIFRILYQLATSEVCIGSLAQTEVLKPMKLTMQRHTEVITIGCETLVRFFFAKKDSLIKQALDVDLVPFLLNLLDGRIDSMENSSRCKALIVKALKSMTMSHLHGTSVNSLLEQSTVWASFRDQNHDLFITTAPSQHYLQGVPTTANYLTQGVTQTISNVPPPIAKEENR